jgi:hypothetical protein
VHPTTTVAAGATTGVASAPVVFGPPLIAAINTMLYTPLPPLWCDPRMRFVARD